jgi:putative GTP pyrophosphokinase
MEVDQIIKTYIDEKQNSYRLLASKTNELLSAIFKTNHIVPHSITFREKDPVKLKEKIVRNGKAYITPLDEITDLAGVRVITYFPSDVDKILPLIKNDFIVDIANSIDKRRASDPSMFGYASLHLIVSFTEARLKLPEYATFKDMKCEIQVRTILQHAWAEIEHDIVYKSHEDIPFELRRRFASLAGLLEIADREFEALKADEAKVRKEIKNTIGKDNIDIPIDLDSLRFYMQKYHKVAHIFNDNLRGLIKLVNAKNITTLRELSDIFSDRILKDADVEVKKYIRASCGDGPIKDCDLRYFIAIAIYFKIPINEALMYANCPALDKDIKNKRKKSNNLTKAST